MFQTVTLKAPTNYTAFRHAYRPIFDVVTTYQQGDWCIMADIFKTRINNSIVPNFVMKADQGTKNQGYTKLGPHRLNSERVTAAQSLKICHYTPVCNLVKICV